METTSATSLAPALHLQYSRTGTRSSPPCSLTRPGEDTSNYILYIISRGLSSHVPPYVYIGCPFLFWLSL